MSFQASKTFTDHSGHYDVAGFSFVSTVRASRGVALSGLSWLDSTPPLVAGWSPVESVSGSRNPSLSSLPVSGCSGGRSSQFSSCKTSGASGAPGSGCGAWGCLLGFRPCPPSVYLLSLASASQLSRGHGMAPAHGDKL